MTGKHEVTARPRVSVITIFYNAEAHFREAIESVLGQDFGDFELLLVDDGSTDSSTAIAREYQAGDARIRYLEHPGHANRGMSATRNLGVAEARGEFVAFIDADDRWRPSKLTEQLELLDRMPEVDAVGGSVNYWGSHAGGKDRVVTTANVRNQRIEPPQATLSLYPLGTADAPSMSDLMFRRESILKAGGFEETFQGAYEDQAFLSKFYLGSTMYIADALWSDYRLHGNSCMAQVERRGSYHDTRREFLRWFQRYLARRSEGHDPRIDDAVERALERYRDRRARVREIAKAVPFAAPLVRSGRALYGRLRLAMAPGPAILMYHRIAEERFDPWHLAVSPANFNDQLDWISRNRAALSLQEFVDLHGRRKLPRNAIALTFDDGYACNAEIVAPLLESYRIPATIFVSPELVALGREFWWDELERIVLGHEADVLRLDGRTLYIGCRQEDDLGWAPGDPPRTPRQKAYQEIWRVLHEKPPHELEEALTELREQAQVPEKPRKSHRPMTPDEVRSVASRLVTIGSHALTHPSLPRLQAEEQAREISASVSACAALTGTRPWSFAYPYGDHEPALERLVEVAGFGCACVAEGSFVGRSANRFALPRIGVGNSDSAQLALRLGRP